MTVSAADDPWTERQQSILARVGRRGFVTIEGLASELGVSAQTIRREIIHLAERGQLQRFHGGAGPLPSHDAVRLDHSAKQAVGRPEKLILARAAARLLDPGMSIYLDVGTTVEACAAELARGSGFTVFTNSMRAAMAFDPDRHEVRVLGGRLAGRDGSLVGDDVVGELRGLSLDAALIACSGIDEAGRVMDFDLEKIAVKRTAIASARRSILLATRSKFGRGALGTIAPLDSFAEVVTESGVEGRTIKAG
jgi:DeoR family glycerol-3-phosphate regulon repressor